VYGSCNLAKEEWDTSTGNRPSDALSLAEQIRRLPHETATFDGRKWVAIPVIVICPGDAHRAVLELLADADPTLLDDICVDGAKDENNLRWRHDT
jgi:hypothetical protein